MRIFTIWDYALIPFYVLLLDYLIRLYNTKANDNPVLAKYFVWGFRIKIFSAIIFALFAEFILGGDTEMFFTAGLDFKKIIFQNSENLKFLTSPAKEFGTYYEANMTKVTNFGYVSASSNLTAIKFVALFSMISFNSYMIISVFFSTISFFGLWGMFKVFYKLYPSYHKIIFMSFFLIPSVLFWGSGILKDTLCLGFLGIGFYAFYLFFFEHRRKLKYLVAALLSFYFIYMIKSYIISAFLPFLLFWLYFKTIGGLKSIAKIVVIGFSVIALALMVGFIDFTEFITENTAENIAGNIESQQLSYQKATDEGGSVIDFGEITPTYAGFAKILPKVLVAVLFRPFLWESTKITSLIAAVEGAALFCLTIFVFFRRSPLTTFKIIGKNGPILFFFLFSIVFATAIGFNCFNLGSLVRYKIPCLPFFLLSLLLIMKKQTELKPLLLPPLPL